ncbi:hypothetical protein BGW36DRAFT_383516 [Talaromyces proteolyticus]|uniref:Uncharacterized protein n=1 Tax=Talaromyces proteolyticus TaxID=1131652 RepID=A0AAD4PVM6_9EURO|nr:uncharacterized protein BGW36DRAFT_383516 [Talaromyces proteolyticus]KAH8693682.1 hypothetical protein BGW36DRAFT_383516 [Talaromyces proteolyticus]
MDFSPQARVVEPPPISRQIVVKIILSIIDILFNVAAGRYAALTGAKINSWSRSSSTAQIIYNKTEIASLGAKAGAFKAAILAFWHFGTEYADLNLPIGLIFAMISSRFGIAVLVTCLVSSLALGTVNEALVKPALVASLFLGSEMIPAITGNSLTTAFWNALSGYLFAVIARREGISSPSSIRRISLSLMCSYPIVHVCRLRSLLQQSWVLRRPGIRHIHDIENNFHHSRSRSYSLAFHDICCRYQNDRPE